MFMNLYDESDMKSEFRKGFGVGLIVCFFVYSAILVLFY